MGAANVRRQIKGGQLRVSRALQHKACTPAFRATFNQVFPNLTLPHNLVPMRPYRSLALDAGMQR